MLNEDEKALYLEIVDHFQIKKYEDYDKDFVFERTLPDEITGEARFNTMSALFTKAYDAFIMDYKEIFWLNGAWHMSMSATGQEFIGTVQFYYNPELGGEPFNSGIVNKYVKNLTLFTSDFKKIKTKVKEIKVLLDLESGDYAKIKKAHDYLVLQNDYVLTQGEAYDGRQHSPIGALVKEYPTVCEAYAEAFQMLMGLYGFKAAYVVGVGKGSDSRYENHAWNYLEVNGLWYLVDVTWDDPVISPYDPNYIRYLYFLVPLSDSHKPNAQMGTTDILPYPVPSPFASIKLNPDTLANFVVVTNGTYLYTGSPISGYESISLEEDPGNFTVTYYNLKDEKLPGAPIEIGKYYFIVKTNPEAAKQGQKKVYFEIVPKIFNVKFYDQNNELIKEEQVAQGKAATAPNLKVPGYNLDGWDTDFSDVQNDLEVKPILSKITAKFLDKKGNELPITLEEISVDAIIKTDYPNEILEDEIFIGWMQGENLIVPGVELTKNLTLTPAISKLKVKINNAKLDGEVYKAAKSLYENEEFYFENKNILVKEVVSRSELAENGTYTITIKIGSKGTNRTQELTLTIQTYEYYLFGFGFSKTTLISTAAGVAAVIIVLIAVGIITKRRKTNQ